MHAPAGHRGPVRIFERWSVAANLRLIGFVPLLIGPTLTAAVPVSPASSPAPSTPKSTAHADLYSGDDYKQEVELHPNAAEFAESNFDMSIATVLGWSVFY